jgi:hypothetical protein
VEAACAVAAEQAAGLITRIGVRPEAAVPNWVHLELEGKLTALLRLPEPGHTEAARGN